MSWLIVFPLMMVLYLIWWLWQPISVETVTVPQAVFTDADLAMMDAEWKLFCTSPGFLELSFEERKIETPGTMYWAMLRHPPNSWDAEAKRFTQPPCDGCLRRMSEGMSRFTISYSDFRQDFPDIDALAILKERLERKRRMAGLRVAAEETLRDTSKKKVQDQRTPA